MRVTQLNILVRFINETYNATGFFACDIELHVVVFASDKEGYILDHTTMSLEFMTNDRHYFPK